MVGNQQVVKELLSSQGEQQVKITRGVSIPIAGALNAILYLILSCISRC